MAKSYDYNQILDLTSDTSTLNMHLNELYDEIINFRKATNECENLFHQIKDGEIKNCYNSIYNTIGKGDIFDPEKGYGLWGNIVILLKVLNELHDNAQADKELDN